MQNTAKIFDRDLLRARRARAVPHAAQYDFLFRDVAAGLCTRLDMIKREFPLVLDLGCATGLLTDQLKARGNVTHVIGADISAQADVVCDAECLPFAQHSLDAVISCLDLHWVNDLPGAFLQIRNALKPDGLFLAAFLGGSTLHELRRSLMDAEISVTGGASPRVSPFADMQDVGALLQRAGFALPVVDNDMIAVEYAHPLRLMHDLRGMGASNVIYDRLKKPTRKTVMMEAARIYQEKFGLEDGRIPATFEVIYMIGWAPHESQSQPLKRGSGKTSLVQLLTPVSPSKDN